MTFGTQYEATFCIHGFSGNAYNAFPFSSFTQSVQHMQSYGDVWIESVENVAAYWLGQKLFSQAQPQSDGDGQTWSWQLSNNFPEGKCLRITVDGGKVYQNGQQLAWDEHGYYQISLDAGSVTLK